MKVKSKNIPFYRTNQAPSVCVVGLKRAGEAESEKITFKKLSACYCHNFIIPNRILMNIQWILDKPNNAFCSRPTQVIFFLKLAQISLPSSIKCNQVFAVVLNESDEPTCHFKMANTPSEENHFLKQWTAFTVFETAFVNCYYNLPMGIL